MAEQATLTAVEKEKKSRGKRRDYMGEVLRIEAHCAACIDILDSQPITDFGKGQRAAYENVLSKIGGKRGK